MEPPTLGIADSLARRATPDTFRGSFSQFPTGFQLERFTFFVKADSLRFVRTLVGLAGQVPVRLAPEHPVQHAQRARYHRGRGAGSTS